MADNNAGNAHRAYDGRIATAERRERYRRALLEVSQSALELETELRRELTDTSDAYTRIKGMARILVATVETANLRHREVEARHIPIEKAEQTIKRLSATEDDPIPSLPWGRTQLEGELLGEAGYKPPAGRKA